MSGSAKVIVVKQSIAAVNEGRKWCWYHDERNGTRNTSVTWFIMRLELVVGKDERGLGLVDCGATTCGNSQVLSLLS